MITMYTTATCGACQLVKKSGVVEELNIDVIDVTANPDLRPEGMGGAPYFVKVTEGGSIRTHTGYANSEMLNNL